MKAVGYLEAGDLHREGALLDLNRPKPELGDNDLLVQVHAVGVNPVDTKIRKNRKPKDGEPEVLGWDAVGIVRTVGKAVVGFEEGQRVYYAGALNRPGCNAEFQAVDARLAALAPKHLSDAEAAAMPLTSLTAWEILFDRLRVTEGGGAGQTLLIIGGGGGVGSILIQLASQLTELKVIASAGSAETRQWCIEMGAHEVIDHHQPLGKQLGDLGHAQVPLIAGLTHTDTHWQALTEIVAPQGHIALIDDPNTDIDVKPLKTKSAALHWEFMFCRSLHQTDDMAEQGAILARVAELLDQGTLKSTLTQSMSPINADNLLAAHELLESHRVHGKVALVGFD